MKIELLTTTNLNNSKKLSKIADAVLNVLLNEDFVLKCVTNEMMQEIYKNIDKELKKELKKYPSIYKEIKKCLENADSKF